MDARELIVKLIDKRRITGEEAVILMDGLKNKVLVHPNEVDVLLCEDEN